MTRKITNTRNGPAKVGFNTLSFNNVTKQDFNSDVFLHTKSISSKVKV